jgi:hypothetical protein
MPKGRYQLQSNSGKVLSKDYHGALLKSYKQPDDQKQETEESGVINKHTNWKDEEKNDQENSKTTTMIATEGNVSDKYNNRMDKDTNDPENSKTSTNIATEDQETSNCKEMRTN